MKILIVEDDPVSQEILKTIVSPYGPCELAGNGLEAVEKYSAALASSQPYELIFLDIMMPVMDGQTALKEIRRREAEQGIGGSDMVKIVMTTALDDPSNVMTALIKGSCEAYITKPITPAGINKTLAGFGLSADAKA